jgi:interleukin-1 receptor-associated kinase 1/coatomer subunit beta'
MPQRIEFEEEDFRKELENLRRLNHPNIIQLLGYCYEIEQEFLKHKGRLVVADKITRALCFEYMHNTSLQGHLDGETMVVLYVSYMYNIFPMFIITTFCPSPCVSFCR